MRRFINCAPLFIIGLAALLEYLGRRGVPRGLVIMGLAGFILWNFLFIFQFQKGLIPQDAFLTYDQMVTDKLLLAYGMAELFWEWLAS